MGRPVLILAVALALATIVLIVAQAVERVAAPGRTAKTNEDGMPDLIRNVAFGLLMVLMIGVVTGWLSGV